MPIGTKEVGYRLLSSLGARDPPGPGVRVSPYSVPRLGARGPGTRVADHPLMCRPCLVRVPEAFAPRVPGVDGFFPDWFGFPRHLPPGAQGTAFSMVGPGTRTHSSGYPGWRLCAAALFTWGYKYPPSSTSNPMNMSKSPLPPPTHTIVNLGELAFSLFLP